MLLKLDDSLIEYIQSNQLTVEEDEALHKLFRSHDNKYHFVFGSRFLFNFLSSHPSMSTYIKRQSKKKYQKYVMLEQKTRYRHSHVIVIPSTESFSRVDNELFNENYNYSIIETIFYIPLKWFCHPAILERTCLISENSSDVNFYFQLAKGISNIYHHNSNVIFSRNSGGGGTTFKVVKDKVEDNNMSLIVVDSDKIHPDDNHGPTCNSVKKTYERFKRYSVLGLKILYVHEKENLLPPTIYGTFGKMHKNIVEPWITIYNSELLYPLYNFADLKEGISAKNYCSFYELLFHEPCRIVAKSTTETWGFNKEFIGSKEEFEKLVVEVKNGKAENKYLLPPLASDVLEDFILKDIHLETKAQLEKIKKSPSNSLAKANHIVFLEEKLQEIESFHQNLNEFHKSYLKDLSDRINDWGFCNTDAV
ncbi:hypothetical protein [Exiguobacterium sp. s146]|uniref:hypothetical protein n=1 Tax=Exiguobacterium sp. s146 TaxID=2751223 RepID=UPI001BEB3F18|nr:hypothetical protein [Exiguobacterium sp. s146]